MIVLDTHAWVFFISNPELLSQRAKECLDAAVEKKNIIISSISVWEIALLIAKKRLILTLKLNDWIAKSEMLTFFKFIPVDNSIAIKSVYLPQPLHSDSADRIIIATAISLGTPIVTKDEKILNYPHVQTIW